MSHFAMKCFLKFKKGPHWQKRVRVEKGLAKAMGWDFIPRGMFLSEIYAEVIYRRFLEAIQQNEASGPPLSERWLEIKRERCWEESKWIATGVLADRLTIIKLGEDEYFVGWDKQIHAAPSSSESMPSSKLAKMLEYGFDKVPPRPIRRKVLRKGVPGIRAMMKDGKVKLIG